MATKVRSMAAALTLKEARQILKSCSYPDGVIWKKRIRYEWQTALKRPVLVELLNTGDLRVTDSKTHEIIAIGPAW